MTTAEAVEYLESEDYIKGRDYFAVYARRMFEIVDDGHDDDYETCQCHCQPGMPLASTEWGPKEERDWLKFEIIPKSNTAIQHYKYWSDNGGNTLL